MSNRTLIEINHDRWCQIKENPQEFTDALIRYLGSASDRTIWPLERFGIRVFGMRRHYDGFDIKWGAHKASEKAASDGFQPK